MYATKALDIAQVISKAENYVLTKDRQAYLPVLHAIEEYIATKAAGKIVVGGRTGVNALCECESQGGLNRDAVHSTPSGLNCGISADLWTLELYSSDIESEMHKCMDFVIAKIREPATEQKRPEHIYNGDYRTAILRTQIPDREYAFFIDYRLVAIGKSLGERKGIDIMSIVSPVIGNGPFGTPDIPLMPRDVQIMRVAHMLYDPNMSAAWNSIFIPQLCSLLALDEQKCGGDQESEEASPEELDSRLQTVQPSQSGGSPDKQTNCIESGILIGEYAVKAYMHTPIDKFARKQYVCLFDGIEDYAERKHFTLNYADVRVPDDFRLRKFVLRKQNNDLVADVFNSTSFEVVPVNHIDGQVVASPLCVLRFLFVDIWALSFVITISPDAGALKKRQNFLRRLAKDLFHWIVEKCPVAMLFPTEYVGIFQAVSGAKMKIFAKSGKKIETRYSVIPKKDLTQLYDDVLARMQAI